MAQSSRRRGFASRLAKLGLVSLSVLASHPVMANPEIPDYYSAPGLNPHREYVNQNSAEYIDPFSGKLQLHYVDAFIPGNGGLDIKVQRSYTSLDEELPHTANRSPWGVGWRTHFGRIIKSSPLCADQVPGHSRDNPILELPDGSRQLLLSPYRSGSDAIDHYGEAVPHYVTVERWIGFCDDAGDVPQFMLKSPDGYTYTLAKKIENGLNHQWYTSEIRDRNGNRLTFTYQDDDKPAAKYPLLEEIAGSDGRQVTFAYYDLDPTRVDHVRLKEIAANGQRWHYRYRASAVDPYQYHLTGVDRPDGSSWQYTYHGPEVPAGRHAVSTVTHPLGGITRYTYLRKDFSNTGLLTTAVASKQIDPVHQVTPGTWRFEYQPGHESYLSGRLDKTTVLGPVATRIYHHYGYQALTSGGANFQGEYWKMGLLLEKLICEPNVGTCTQATALQSQTLEWKSQMISDDDTEGPRGFSVAAIHAPLLTREKILRDGIEHTTEHLQHDAYGNTGLQIETGNSSRTTELEYQINREKWIINQLATETLQGIGTIERQYDDRGNLIASNRYGVVTRYAYHPSGDLGRRTDARLFYTDYDNYHRGIAGTESRPEGVQISRVINDTGTIASQTDGRGNTTHYDYDALNRLSGIVFPVNAPAAIEWSGRTRTLTRGGYQEISVHDGFGRIVRSEKRDTGAGINIGTDSTLDAVGRRTFTSYPNSEQGTRYVFDALDRLLRISHPDDTAMEYRYLPGNGVETVNERGMRLTKWYRTFGDPEQRELVRLEAPESVAIDIGRNLLGQIEKISQNGRSRSFVYDDRNYLVRRYDGEKGWTRFERDELGNMTSRRLESHTFTTRFDYDGLNRLVGIDYPYGEVDVRRQYDANDNLVRLENGHSIWVFDYDENDNLTREILEHEILRFQIDYQYDELDFVSHITYPSGRSIAYNPDALGRPTTALPIVTRALYHPNGALASMHYANGQQTEIELDQRLWIERIHTFAPPHPDATPNTFTAIVDLDYSYDGTGNVSEILDGLDAENDRLMRYDDLDRLIHAQGRWGISDFSYDPLGNLLSNSINGESTDYAYDNYNRLVDVSGRENRQFRYDRFGNIIDNGIGAFEYDAASALVRAEHADLDYRYDGENRLISKTKGSEGTFVVSGRNGNHLHELQLQDLQQKDYVYLGSKVVARIDYNCVGKVPDRDDDGIPDCAERPFGLDPDDPADATLDFDQDGLTNLAEFQQGTRLLNPDTDADRMPDGWEVAQRLNPLADDAAIDADGDGHGNLAEYQGESQAYDAASIPNGAVYWELALDDLVHTSPAVDDHGVIYLITESGTLYAVDPDGSMRWTGTTDPDCEGAVAIGADGTIYAGCENQRLHAFDPDGKLKWVYADAGGWPVVTADRIYIASGDPCLSGQLHALTPDGNELWSIETTGSLNRSLVVDPSGTVYGVSNLKFQNYEQTCKKQRIQDLYAIAPDGSINWTLDDMGYVEHSPSIGIDGSLYIGQSDWQGTKILVINSDGSYQRETLDLLRARDEIPMPHTPPLATDGSFFKFGIFLFSFYPDAELRSDYLETDQTNSKSLGLSIGADDQLYTSGLHSLVAVNEDGSTRWEPPYYEEIGATTTPVLLPDGTLLMTSGRYSSDSALYAIANNGAAGPAESPWPMPAQNLRRTHQLPPCEHMDTDRDALPDCYEARVGSDKWDPEDAWLDTDGDGLTLLEEFEHQTHPYNLDSDGDHMPDGYEVVRDLDPKSNTSLLDSDGDGAIDAVEFMANTDPSDPVSNPAAATLLWTHEIGYSPVAPPAFNSRGHLLFQSQESFDLFNDTYWKWMYPSRPPRSSTLVVDGNYGVFETTTTDNDYYASRVTLHYHDKSSSFPPLDLGGGQVTPLALAEDGILYAGTRDTHQLHALQGIREILWSLTLDGQLNSAPVIGMDGRVYAATRNGVLYAVTPEGDIDWQLATEEEFAADLAVGVNDTVYMGSTAGSLLAVDREGNLQWRFSTNGAIYASPVVDADGTVYIGTSAGGFYAIDTNGNEKWSVHVGDAILTTAAIAADGQLFVASAGGVVHAFDPNGSKLWEYALAGATDQASPALDGNGILYVGTSNGLLYALYSGSPGPAMAPWPMYRHDHRLTGNAATGHYWPDLPPLLTILSPIDGAVFLDSDRILLDAQAENLTDGVQNHTIEWHSDVDGLLGHGANLEVMDLTPGFHNLAAHLSDSQGEEATASVRILVEAQDQIKLTLNADLPSPQDEGQSILLTAAVTGTLRPHEFQFSIKKRDTFNQWQILKDYSLEQEVLWSTWGYGGHNRLRVSARPVTGNGATILKKLRFHINRATPQ